MTGGFTGKEKLRCQVISEFSSCPYRSCVGIRTQPDGDWSCTDCFSCAKSPRLIQNNSRTSTYYGTLRTRRSRVRSEFTMETYLSPRMPARVAVQLVRVLTLTQTPSLLLVNTSIPAVATLAVLTFGHHRGRKANQLRGQENSSPVGVCPRTSLLALRAADLPIARCVQVTSVSLMEV